MFCPLLFKTIYSAKMQTDAILLLIKVFFGDIVWGRHLHLTDSIDHCDRHY